jgi:hypothetical protein
VTDSDAYRRLAAALDDVQTLISFIALLPYAVKVNREAEHQALVASRIPVQRHPVDLWPVPRPTPQGVPPRSRIQPRRRVP